MTIDQRNQIAKDTKLELDGRRRLLKKLERVMQSLRKTAENEKAKREARAASLMDGYKSEQEIHDAYGWAAITYGERERLLDALEKGRQYVDDTLTPTGVAIGVLYDIIKHQRSDISSLEFDLLPPDQQAQRIKANEEWQERLAARRAVRNNESEE